MLTALAAALALAQTVEVLTESAAGDRVTVREDSTMTMEGDMSPPGAPGVVHIRREESETKEYEVEVLAVGDDLASEGRVRFASFSQRVGGSIRVGEQTQEQPEETIGESLAGCVFLIRRGGDPERTTESGEPAPEDLKDVDDDLLGDGSERAFLPGRPVAVGESWPVTAEGAEWIRRSFAPDAESGMDVTDVAPDMQVRLDRIEETEGRRLAHLAVSGEVTFRGTARDPNIFGDDESHPLLIKARFSDAEWVIDMTARRPAHGVAEIAMDMTFGPEDRPAATFTISGHTETSFAWRLDR